MRHLLLILLFTGVAQAKFSAWRDASSTTIPAAFTTNGSSIVANLRRQKHIACNNLTTAKVAVCYGVTNPSNCPTNGDFILGPSQGFASDEVYFEGDIYLKEADGSTITSGWAGCKVW